MSFKIARILLFISGLFPTIVGIYYYFYFLTAPQFHFVEHIAFTNLIFSGITILILVSFELKPTSTKPWVLFLIIFNILWTSGNDTYAALRNYSIEKVIFPYPIFPLTLGVIAIFLLSLELKRE